MNILLSFVPIILLFVMYVFIENTLLIVREYKLRVGLGHGRSLRIVQISDLHKKKFGGGYKVLINRISGLAPDVIFITGDLVSRTETDFKKKGAFLRSLNEICPVICVKGNHELDLKPEIMERLRNEITGAGVTLLENSAVNFTKNDVSINVYGADLKRSVYRDKNNGFRELEKYTADELRSLFGAPHGLSVLLAHSPLFFEEYAKWGADVTFSGHVHGGVIATPFGGLLSPERKFFPKFYKGVYHKDGKRMVVSAGIGKIRIFNPSEIALVELV